MSPTSSWSPFRGQLILSNLPPQIRPSQIRKILTLLPPPDEPVVVKPRDPGLEVVQVYPRPVKARRDPSARLWRFGRKMAEDRMESKTGRSTCGTKVERQDRPVPTERPQNHAQDAEQPIERTTTHVREVAYEGEPEDEPGIVPKSPRSKSDKNTAVAYLYFRNDYARWQAEMAFRSLTIDGRKVQVDAKVVDTAPIRRLWAKMH